MVEVNGIQWKTHKEGPLKYLAYKKPEDKEWTVTDKLYVNFSDKLEKQVKDYLKEGK